MREYSLGYKGQSKNLGIQNKRKLLVLKRVMDDKATEEAERKTPFFKG